MGFAGQIISKLRNLKFFRVLLSAIALVIVTAQSASAMTVTIPAQDDDGNYVISWSGAKTYGELFELVNGVYKSIWGGNPGTFSVTGKAQGTYQYKINDCYVTGSQGGTTTTCTSSYYTVVVGVASPTITDIADRTILEDGTTGAISFTIGDADTPVASLTLSKSSNNQALIPDANIVLGGSGTARTITVTPLPNAYGVATITVSVSDGGRTTSDTFVVTVTSVNDAPTISSIGPVTVNQDTSTGPISFSVNDVETPGSLQVSAASSNPTLVASQDITLSGSGTNRTISILPRPGFFGTSTITLSVSDGSLTTSTSFVLTVNDIPATLSIDSNDGAGNYTLSWKYGNQSIKLFESRNGAADVDVMGGEWATVGSKVFAKTLYGNYTYKLYECTHSQSGSNCTALASTKTVTVTLPVPTINAYFSPATINESGSSTLYWSSTNATSCSATGVSGVSATGGNVTYNAPTVMSANQNATVRITCTGNGGSTDYDVPITINYINDTPIISSISSVTINEDNSSSALPFTISDEETAATSLTLSGTSSNTALIPNGNIVFGGSGSARTVTVIPAANAYGTATITVAVSDGNSTSNSSFTVTVNSVNDAPTITAIPAQTINQETNTGQIAFTINDVDTPIGNLVVSATSSSQSVVANSEITLGGSGNNRTIYIQPAAIHVGVTNITVTVSDGALTSSILFPLTINDLPATLSIDSNNGQGNYSLSWKYGNESIKLFESFNGAADVDVMGGEWGPSGSKSFSKTIDGTYTYKLYECVHGQYGATCNTLTSTKVVSVALPVPTVPTLVVSPTNSSDGNYTVSWGAYENGVTHYDLYENGSATPIYSGLNTSFTPTTKPTGSFNYKVIACTAYRCSAPSAIKSVNVAIVGSLGSVNVSLSLSTGIATLNWANITATQFKVQPKLNGIATGPVQIFTTNTPILSPVSAPGSYSYEVTACAVGGEYTNCGTPVQSNTVVLAIPARPVINLPASSTTNFFYMKWGPVSNAVTYTLTENGNNFSASSAYDYSPVDKPNGRYTYTVKACNIAGCSPISIAKSIDVVAVNSVSNVVASLLQSTGVTTLTWNPTPADYYSIQIKLNGANYGSPITTTVANYTFPAMTDAGTYSYEVSACASAGSTTNCASPVSSNSVTPLRPDAPLLSAPWASNSGIYAVTWSKSLWATHYKLYENGVLIQDSAEVSKVFDQLHAKTSGVYIYTVKACYAICSADSNSATTPVTIPTTTSSSATGTETVFNFQTDAPSNFTYSLDSSGVPDVGANQFVAATQGNINVNNGAAQYTIKIDLPPAVRDLKPSLSLSYNSRGGNGLMGMGWNLNGLSSITRCRTSFAVEGAEAQKSNPRYTNGDRLCLDGQKLVVASMTTPANDSNYWASGTEYRTEIDNFSRIVAYSSDNGSHAYLKVFTKDGRIFTYGGEFNNQNSRIRQPGNANSVVGIWLLDNVEDAYGNNYRITYLRDTANGSYYPDRINWGPDSAVKFEYQNRTGQTPGGYDMGGRYSYPKILQKVTTYISVPSASDPTSGTAVKQYQINYKLGAATQRELVDTISECGYNAGSWQCARPLTFTWQAGEFGFDDSQPKTAVYCSSGAQIVQNDTIHQIIDLDGDGYNDILANDVIWGTSTGCFNSSSYTYSSASPPSGTRAFTQSFMTKSGYALLIGTTLASGQVEIGIISSLKGPSRSYKLITTLSKEVSGDVAGVDLNNDGLDDIAAAGSSFLQLDQLVLGFASGPTMGGSHLDGAPSYIDLTGDGVRDELFTSSSWIQAKKQDGSILATFSATPAKDYEVVQGGCYGGVRLLLKGGLTSVIADLNGDGQKDYAFFHLNNDPVSSSNPNGGQYEWMYRLNLQNATSDEVNTHVVNPKSPVTNYPSNVYSYGYDWDKDGRDDLLALAPGPNPCRQRVLLSRDNGNQITFTELKDATGATFTTYVMEGSICAPVAEERTANIFKGDINNDGAIDIWTNSDKIYYGKPQQPDLLTVVTDGFGAQTKLEYSTLTGADNNGKPLYTPETVTPTFPQAPTGRSLQVVKKLSVSNAQGGFNDRFFNYMGARVDLQGRGFLGFANILVNDVANSVVTSTDYRLGFPFNGRVDSVTTKALSGKLISNVKNVYTLHATNTRFPYLNYSIQKSYQLTTTDLSQPLSATKVTNTYDVCGNLTEQISDVGTGVTGAVVTGVLGHKRVFNEVNNYSTTNDCSDDFTYRTTQEMSKTSTSDDLRSVITEFTPTNNGVGVHKEIAVTTAYKGTALERNTTITRNSNGVITGSQDVAKDIDSGTSATRNISMTDLAQGLYPQTITNSLNSGDLVTNARYDYRFGQQIYVKTPNGLATTRIFDSLGRVVDEYSPDMTRRELVAFYCPSLSGVSCPTNAAYGVATRVTNSFLPGMLGAPLSITFYDNLQRPVRTTTYTLNGKAINIDQVYRPDGKIDKVSEPYTQFATGWSTYADYDELGVPHTETAADGGSRATNTERVGNSYHITQIATVLKSSGSDVQTSQRYVNPLGQVEKVIDSLNTPVDYTYNSLGVLATTRVNNNANTLININYDVAGNKSNMIDPDAGVIDFEYNGFGELRRQTWQKGTSFAKSVTLNYDQLGRQVSRVDQPVSGASTSYQWVWDTQQKGLLTSESGNGQTISYQYDELGRLSSMNTSISGLTDKYFSYGYDAFSRPTAVVYPNGLTINNLYHAAGMAVRTQDITDPANPKVLWALGNDVDSRGSFVNQLWGNGVATQNTFDANGQLQAIKSGRLTTSNTISNLNGDIQDLSYSFDSIGNLESRTTQRRNIDGSARESITERFAYDKLNRLKTSTTSGFFARYKSYDYDELGNLTNRVDNLGTSTINDDVGILAYAGTNGAGVHAVTSAGGISYQYDKYGNVIQRGSETITYDVFNKPTRISSSTTTTTIDYDANHNRFRESDSSGTTYTIAGGLYEEIVAGSKRTQKSYINGVIVNTQVYNGSALASNDTQYVHTDHLGSSEAISDKLGAFVDRMSFSDWGNRQKADWKTGSPTLNFPTNNGYTGHHELDKHNLVHMGGRVYDPRIGRFMSADLFAQSPYSTQSYNRYSYAFNNPMTNIDPTGYCSGPDTMSALMCEKAFGIIDQMHQESVLDAMNSINAYENKKLNEKNQAAVDEAFKDLQPILNGSDENEGGDELGGIGTSLSSGSNATTSGDEANEVIVTGVRSLTLNDKAPSKFQDILRIGNINLDRNAQLAARMNIFQFGNAVWPGHMWDYKNNKDLKLALKSEGKYDSALLAEFGNWHYGFVARAQGMKLSIALIGAGTAQTLVQGGGHPLDWFLGAHMIFISNQVANQLVQQGFSFGDKSDDPQPIADGYNFYNK